jgi:hypothetical protein
MPMAVPNLTSPSDFPSKLHKKKGYKDQATIYGTDIKKGDEVNVNGTRGKRPTNWSGTIKKDNGDGSFDVEDLKVDHEEEHNGHGHFGAGGSEDVSVTVSNAMRTSDPVTTVMAPTIP